MTDIRESIHQKFADGELPTNAPTETSAGYGSGADCSGCDDAILRAQIEHKFQDETTTRLYQFHVGCYAIWLTSVRRAKLRRKLTERAVP